MMNQISASRNRLAIGISTALLLIGHEAGATIIDDGVLRLDTEGTKYQVVTLNGGPFNESLFVHSFYFDDQFRASFVLESSTATSTVHSGLCFQCTQIVTTEILGPLAGLPGSAQLLQTVEITRNADQVTPQDYTVHSYYQSRNSSTGRDTGNFDPVTGAVFSYDETYFFAMVAASSGGEVAQWGVADFTPGGPHLDEFAALTNGGGGVAGNLVTELGMGFAITLDPGETVTLSFLQLHASGIQAVPSNLAVPEPRTALAEGVALLALVGLHRKLC